MTPPGWSVLSIGGPSGVGKTTAARALADQYRLPWLMVDDLRLALMRSQVTLPHNTEALYFLDDPQFRHVSAERMRDQLIGLAEVMSPSIEVVIENHVDQDVPVIIEGDGVLPSLLARGPVQTRSHSGRVRAVFIIEANAAALHANVLARARGIHEWTAEEVQREAHAKWLYGQWLAQEAQRFGLPVVAPRPWDSLLDRLVAATTILLPLNPGPPLRHTGSRMDARRNDERRRRDPEALDGQTPCRVGDGDSARRHVGG